MSFTHLFFAIFLQILYISLIWDYIFQINMPCCICVGGILGLAPWQSFPCPWAIMLALHQNYSTTSLTTPQKELSDWILVELKILDFNVCTRTDISNLAPAADFEKIESHITQKNIFIIKTDIKRHNFNGTLAKKVHRSKTFFISSFSLRNIPHFSRASSFPILDCQVVPYVLGDAFYEYSPNKLAGFSFGKNFLVDLKEEFVKHGHEGKTIAYLKVYDTCMHPYICCGAVV